MNIVYKFFSHCCARRKVLGSEPGERTPMLPPPENGPSILTYDSITIDHENAKKRLHDIVKSKEGKMVRVLSRGPFDLRTDSRNGRSHSSRNLSPSTFDYNYSRATDYVNGQGPSRRPSSSRPSPPISLSESVSSIRRASTSRVSTSEEYTESLIEHKLKAHLIVTNKSSQRAFSRRGRSRMKHGRFTADDQVPSGADLAEGTRSMVADRQELGADINPDRHRNPRTDVARVERPEVTRKNDEYGAPAIEAKLGDTLRINFDNVGALTRSWSE